MGTIPIRLCINDSNKFVTQHISWWLELLAANSLYIPSCTKHIDATKSAQTPHEEVSQLFLWQIKGNLCPEQSTPERASGHTCCGRYGYHTHSRCSRRYYCWYQRNHRSGTLYLMMRQVCGDCKIGYHKWQPSNSHE